jgi:osmotically inducible lipoprotein OsmB
MKKLILGLLMSLAILGVTGCTVMGAVAGGVAGHELSGGSKAGTIGGAVAGGLIGHELGR